ncbi:translation elongation factor 4 [Zunongwangia profunda]|jgi:GTP-binding protein LepA|uniref:Elongation factor 4 n=3 Tax=Zunongwangia profunda TaxID=398743 RepID=D5BBD2_ZUNPS|nr:translation elongation factor 4 [Zunongwangia profunda]MAC63238.1 elongation factor 4 [Flavobacteriaceae bacterium]MAS70718.1 elongation factor 4 [Zunongwangia sp.]ADF50366.1 GTP-binding protein LepA [Zunongwangia profunda SM-A87]MCC4230370.1 translation elongation factor 4 [Zunongwangia profunda]HAJ82577.1 elongation factor 4 [Zunongwangia profunda]|tara:strand:+ start:1731 stop:3527 length:1797 start_codon:yes stop_codon:yes gene_type:complete
MKHIRNFCIIAHIDHGKSTLADRLLDFTGSVTEREKQAQLLDNMDLERERGITIKSHAIQMDYVHEGEHYTLNLIDTPGHVDFSYEVSRSIAACEGALLVVDAAQSIQAQTISNLYLALENDLEIIPVLNKVDLPSANPEEVTDDIVDLLGCDPDDVIPASAKTGIGIEEILHAIITKIPAPSGKVDAPLRALIFDSVYNPFRGVETFFRVINGSIKKNQHIKFVATGKDYSADEVGTLKLIQHPKQEIKTGDVGYLITGIKDAREVKVGDTITDAKNPTTEAVAGFEDVKPMVFAGIYPVDTEDYEELRASMEKLQLNDASLVFTPESSAALGFGFRCGFLGMLHLEIIQERLEREFDMTVITTVPNVSYNAYTNKHPDEVILVNNPSDLPEPSTLNRVEEPYIKATIITKSDYVGNVMSLCIEKRGEITNQTYLTTERVELSFDMPLAEIVFDFYDRLKTVSRGYASFDYSPVGLRTSKLVKVDVLLNGNKVDALSALLHQDNAYDIGKKMCEKLKELIPRQQFDIPIQAAIGAKIISRETVKALRKDVTAKCYGGDISRKRKLLEKQKKGKKRMRQVGNVEIPQEAFMAVLKLND